MYSHILGSTWIGLFFSVLFSSELVEASLGDKTYEFKNCYDVCYLMNCTKPNNLDKFKRIQGWPEKILLWSCEDECRYMCMWKTVDLFEKKNLKVPQFYGKWPFVRLLGIQEPASMIFSVMNALGCIYGLRLFLSKVSRSNPYYRPCLGFAVLSINAWIWSIVFHTRDKFVTEVLDYFSATLVVLYSLYLSIHRISMGILNPDPDRGKILRRLSFLVFIVFFLFHISYLLFTHFDYGYNMLVNVVAGLSNAAGWFYYHWATRKDFSHQWKATYAACYTMVLLIFEVLDFLPIWWIFDGHSIWHLGTVIFPFLWFSFLVDECSLFLNLSDKEA